LALKKGIHFYKQAHSLVHTHLTMPPLWEKSWKKITTQLYYKIWN